ncbi:hypothetical protein A7J46_00300 [Escherichia coli]|nr:hypothetical protein A7J46_00300 [Escherichia coli]
MPSEHDEQLDSTDTQLPGEYDLFDLMVQVTEENLHAPVKKVIFAGKLRISRIQLFIMFRWHGVISSS